jgi:DNA-binding transcriptional LysR family regulator
MTHHDQAPRGDAALLDPKLLHLFEVLYTTGSVTRAAELLGQSQPTVSIWLGKLRAQLADPLFVRTMQGMQPTPRADAPGVVLAASSISNTLAQALQNGQADLALGYLPWLDTGIYQQTLYEQDWICLTNTRHPRVPDDAPEHWNLPVYQAEAHIGISSGTGQHLLENALAGQGITRQVRLELPGFLGLSAILSSSDLIATLPRHIGETLARAAGLRTLPCPFTIAGFTVKQYWHTRYHQDPASRWLRGVCADLFMRRFKHEVHRFKQVGPRANRMSSL